MKQTSVSPLASLISTATLAALVATAALAGAPALAQQAAPATTKPPPATAPAAAAPAITTAAPANTPATAPAATPAAAATSPAATQAAPASTAATTPGNDTAAAPAADAATAPVTAANDTTTAPNPARAPLGVPAAPYSNAATGGGLMQTTFALAFVIALLLGGAWMLKRFGPRSFGGGNNTVKLVGALSVGARERIIVVEVGEQWIVVGASPGRMNALATMARQEAPEVAPGSQPMAAPANFADWIKHTIDKRNNSKQ